MHGNLYEPLFNKCPHGELQQREWPLPGMKLWSEGLNRIPNFEHWLLKN